MNIKVAAVVVGAALGMVSTFVAGQAVASQPTQQVVEAIRAPGPESIRTVIETVQMPVEVPVEVIKTVEVEKIVEVPKVQWVTTEVTRPVTVRFFEDGSYRIEETGQGGCPPMPELLCNSEHWTPEFRAAYDAMMGR